MQFIQNSPIKHGQVLFANAPEGVDAIVLARKFGAVKGLCLLHVARDDARMARMRAAISFFAPDVEVLTIPAWDCQPYDRVGPHRDLLAERIDALTTILEAPPPEAGRLALTTVGALIQRLPPRNALAGRSLVLEKGMTVRPDELAEFLTKNAYVRVETVGEPGEFALRGGLIDVYPPGEPQPLRLDFFGDEIESLRAFDPFSQLTTHESSQCKLKPVGELTLDPETIERFRSGYRAAFGAPKREDPLYEAISAARLYPGMEHWLPLFHEKLETIFDYLPEAEISFDHQAEEVRDVRLETIADLYAARLAFAEAKDAGGVAYRPLPPERLYLDSDEWAERVAERPSGHFSPFAAPPDAVDVMDVGGRPGRDFADARTGGTGALYESVVAFVAAERVKRRVLIAGYSTGSRERLAQVLADHGLAGTSVIENNNEVTALEAERVAFATLELERGFATHDLVVVTEQDILGERLARPQRRRLRPENFLTEATSLETGDLVVHADHGIGRYEGLQTLDVGGAPHDCLRLIYAGGDKLFLPVENIEVLSRYGSQDLEAELDRLGQGNWQARKSRVKKRIRDIADQLIKIAAARAVKKGEPLAPPQGLFEEFCARFPFAETDDQLVAIEDTIADMAGGTPMDRLVCGDVGFGKTEVALRAAFVAAMNGRQVAVVAPTTLLCRQHLRTFRERFAGLPLRIEQLSRLTGSREAAAIKEDLRAGRVDIVIGTHALLAESVAYSDLGLVVVDEEQHFGVKQKERLKRLREEVHVLTLTATPIPRTLQLALTGVKEMSIIATPPVDRLAVRTFVTPYDPVVIREAIMREHHRGGQVFYVCPRIEDLAMVEERLRKLVPEVRIATAHGQLAARRLEDVMTAFYERRFDLLLSTNIVESGLDIPTANTMVIHRADMFGLAQLYQLRGRIGRSKVRAYAYLTLPPGQLLTPSAEKRLEVMQTLDTLGAGFQLASHDLDIRGAGNLLGEEQSGHIREVGIELYQQMLEDAVQAARAGGSAEITAPGEHEWTPQINLGTPVLIPDTYVADLNVRLSLYRRLATLVTEQELEGFAAEMIDRFGQIPPEVDNLLQVMTIKQLCRTAGVEKLDVGPKGAVFSFHEGGTADPVRLVSFIQARSDRFLLRPDQKLVYRDAWDDGATRMKGVRKVLGQLAELAA